MPAITTEKPKVAELKDIDTKALERRVDVAGAKRSEEKKKQTKEVVSKTASPQKSVVRGAQLDRQADGSDKSSCAQATEENTEEKSVTSHSPVRRMVQSADQWRNCRRPHRI